MNYLLPTLIVSLAMATGRNIGSEGKMGNSDTTYIRPPAVAGSFYPGSPIELAKMIAEYFHAAPKPQIAGKPLTIIAPHAGYIYSGQIAAKGYKILEGEEFKTVIVISPSHTVYFKGVSAFGGKAYSTPIGDVPINIELTKKIVAHDSLIQISQQGHLKSPGRSEHALEVQLPFLQTVLGKFDLVALVMGDQDIKTCQALGDAIAAAIGNRDDVLIVASSDLSHFHDAAAALRLDSIIKDDIQNLDYRSLAGDLNGNKTEACGGGPIIAAMIASEKLGADSSIITGFGNSGEATGDKSEVVGYLSAVLYKSPESQVYRIGEDSDSSAPDFQENAANIPVGQDTDSNTGLSTENKKMLLAIARQSMECYLEGRDLIFPAPIPEALNRRSGAFVTLHQHGELRGCIGTFREDVVLYKVVSDMAIQAAFSDFRFRSVNRDELASIDIEISVLTPMRRIYNTDLVVVGRDGLYLKRGNNSGVLLPQVPVEENWDRLTFLDHTCLKAGLASGSWRDKQTEIYVFQAEVFGER